MAITWSEAVADADNADDAARYERAVAQALELDPLIQDFIVAVIEAGKWPMAARSDWDQTPAPSQLRIGASAREIRADADGSWRLVVGKLVGGVVSFEPGHRPWIGHYQDRSSAVASNDFDALTAAMDETKDWVPRELVAYLRREKIPLPSDS
jgi:hypothetical protein